MYKEHQQFTQVYRLTHVRFHSCIAEINSGITCIIGKSSVGFGQYYPRVQAPFCIFSLPRPLEAQEEAWHWLAF